MRSESGKANTEELRQSVVHFRALFDELLKVQGATPPSRRERQLPPTRRTRSRGIEATNAAVLHTRSVGKLLKCHRAPQ